MECEHTFLSPSTRKINVNLDNYYRFVFCLRADLPLKATRTRTMYRRLFHFTKNEFNVPGNRKALF